MNHADRPLVVLHAGGLDSVHLSRWVGLTRESGHTALVAGHLRLDFEPATLPPGVESWRSPQLPWASTRRAAQTGSTAHRLAAALPNPLVEVPLCAAWLRRLVARLRPDVVHAHWLPHWGAAAALAGVRPLVVGAMGSDVTGPDVTRHRLAGLALSRADCVIAPSPHARELLSRRAGERCLHLEAGVDLEAFRPPDSGPAHAGPLAAGPGRRADGAQLCARPRPCTGWNCRPGVCPPARRAARCAPLVAHGPLPLDRHTREQLAGRETRCGCWATCARREWRSCCTPPT